MTWRKASVPKKNTLMRAAVLADENEIPDNHALTVRDRVLSTDLERIVQNNVKTDTVTLDLDGEWDDCTVYVTFNDETARSGPWSFEWRGQPLTIPSAIGAVVGPVAVSVVGYGSDGELRLVTEAAPSLLDVVKSGYVEIVDDNEENQDILSQMVAAGQAAEDAAEAANAAATSATSAASSANTAASSANAAAAATNGAAEDATAAAQNALNIANYIASIEPPSDDEVQELREENATLATALVELQDGYIVLGETAYMPTNRRTALSSETVTVAQANVSGETATLN